MKQKHKIAHMKAALAYAECSTAKRLQVGCVLVKNDTIISIGYNGTPIGWDNCCEEYIFFKDGRQLIQPLTKTKPEVSCAEMNAVSKLAKSTNSGDGAVAFITHSPCPLCAKLMYNAGIKEVYYQTVYRLDNGIEFLKKCGILVEQLTVK